MRSSVSPERWDPQQRKSITPDEEKEFESQQDDSEEEMSEDDVNAEHNRNEEEINLDDDDDDEDQAAGDELMNLDPEVSSDADSSLMISGSNLTTSSRNSSPEQEGGGYGYQEVEENNDWVRVQYVTVAEQRQRNRLAELEQFRDAIITDEDRANVRAFKVLMAGISRDAFRQMRLSFSDYLKISSEYVIINRMATLSGIEPLFIDCCITSCIAYTHQYEELEECPHCREPRYLAGTVKPRRVFCYIPFIPQLQNLLANPEMSKLLLYRHNFTCEGPDVYKDFFDSSRYSDLRDTEVVVDGQPLGFCHFSNPRDVAFATCTDGFLLFGRTRKGPSATPILIQILNLPPQIRTHSENLICVGVIPGPSQPKEMYTFMAPFEDEVAELAKGVLTFDGLEEEMFDLHGYQVFNSGDILAAHKCLGTKGVSSRFPCRNCNLEGVRDPEGPTVYYLPLRVPNGPQAAQVNAGRLPYSLPMRTHGEIVATLNQIAIQPTDAAKDRLQKATGIKNWPIFRRVNTMDYSKSVPWDWMHAFCENIIPNLVDLWMGRFKGIDEGVEEYEIPAAVWKQIADETVQATEHIPADFVRVLKHLLTQRAWFTAEAWCFWFMYLFPILFKGRFRRSKYYKHGCQLVDIMKATMKFVITGEELDELQERIVEWVVKYERYYYQHNIKRLPVCVLPVHGLLHIVDDIRTIAPSWVTWTWFMERFCGSLKRALRSRSRPWANLDNRCLNVCYLRQLGLLYDLKKELEGARTKYRREPWNVLSRGEKAYADYPEHVVNIPSNTDVPMPHTIRKAVVAHVKALLDNTVSEAVIKKLVPDTYTMWGKIRLGRSAYIRTRWARGAEGGAPTRNASYIRYQTRHQVQGETVTVIGYGELVDIVVVELPRKNILQEFSGKELLLALVEPAATGGEDARETVVRYGAAQAERIIDVFSIMGTIGRVKTRGRWYVIDRFEDRAEAKFDDDDINLDDVIAEDEI